jgi:hypothetical protein
MGQERSGWFKNAGWPNLDGKSWLQVIGASHG